MNICFLYGTVIEIDDFKFIIEKNRKHKSQIEMKLQLIDECKTKIKIIAYDKMADYILRNNFLNQTILVQGYLRENFVEVYCLESCKNYHKKSRKKC